MSVQIGELLVNLRASTASFAKDLDKASQLSFNTSREIERSFKFIGGAIAGALTAATVAVAGLAEHAIETADRFNKLSQSTGLSVEQFSGLAYAANLSDVSTEALSKSLVILAKNLEKSNQQTLEGKAAHSALATLFRGSIPNFKDTNDAFEQIAQQLSLLPDGYQKTALAAQIFGKQGASLIPLLNGGAEGLKRLKEEAERLGVVFDTKTAKAAEEFNDNIKRLKTSLEGIGNTIAQKTLPGLVLLTEAAVGFAKSKDKWAEFVELVQHLVDGLGPTGAAGAAAGLAAQMARLGQVAQEQFTIFGGVTTQFDKFFDTLSKGLHKDFGLDTKPYHELTDAEKKLAETLKDTRQRLQEEIITFNQGTVAAEAYRLKLLGASDAQIQTVTTLQKEVVGLKNGFVTILGIQIPKHVQEITESLGTFDETQQKLLDKGFQAWEKARTPLEKYSHDVADLKILFDAQIIDQETFNRLTKEWADNLNLVATKVDSMQTLSKDFQKSIGEAFNSAITGARSFGDIMKSLLVAMEEAILKELVFKEIAGALSGSGGFLGFVGGIFGRLAGKASGGPVSAGTPYMVGENGPELFMPSSSGNIVPNGKVGGTTVVYQIDARGADASVEFRIRRAIAESENRSVAKAVVAVREMSLRTT